MNMMQLGAMFMKAFPGRQIVWNARRNTGTSAAALTCTDGAGPASGLWLASLLYDPHPFI